MLAKDFQCADWLRWFGDEEKGPFALPDGRRAATDGKTAMITAEPGDTGPCYGKTGEVPQAILDFITLPASHSCVVDAARLRKVIGPCQYIEATTCPDCKGSKESVCPHCDQDMPCETCDETGTIDECPDDRPVILWGVVFNANLIAYMLEKAPVAERYTLRLVRSNQTTDTAGKWQLHVVTDAWHGIVVQMVDSVKERKNPPDVTAAITGV